MNDDPENLLSGLPRHRASDEFTSRVLGRLDRQPAPSLDRRRLAAAAALILCLSGAAFWSYSVESRQEAARVRAIRAEKEAIRRELEELKRQTRPIDAIRIEGDRVDFVIDLSNDNKVALASDTLPPV